MKKHKNKTRIEFGFKSKNQVALFCIMKIYYDENGDIYFGKILFEIKGKEYRQMEKEIHEEYLQKISKNNCPYLDKKKGKCTIPIEREMAMCSSSCILYNADKE